MGSIPTGHPTSTTPHRRRAGANSLVTARLGSRPAQPALAHAAPHPRRQSRHRLRHSERHREVAKGIATRRRSSGAPSALGRSAEPAMSAPLPQYQQCRCHHHHRRQPCAARGATQSRKAGRSCATGEAVGAAQSVTRDARPSAPARHTDGMSSAPGVAAPAARSASCCRRCRDRHHRRSRRDRHHRRPRCSSAGYTASTRPTHG